MTLWTQQEFELDSPIDEINVVSFVDLNLGLGSSKGDWTFEK